MDWYLAVLKKYAVFSGRARRMEFWMFTLVNFLVSIVLAVVDSILFGWGDTAGPIGGLYSLAVLLPSIGVAIRRLHDTNRSGWWLLLSFIPVIGWIALLFFFVQDSDEGENQYGPNPKTDSGPAAAAI